MEVYIHTSKSNLFGGTTSMEADIDEKVLTPIENKAFISFGKRLARQMAKRVDKPPPASPQGWEDKRGKRVIGVRMYAVAFTLITEAVEPPKRKP